MTKVFIDGSAGTTGLRIFDRLAQRDDIQLITLTQERRKDTDSRRQALNSADVVFLCLPDDAAAEAVGLIENDNVTVIDTSTAHRTLPEWAYGFPELSDSQEAKIASSKRIAVPGCHACGFIALVQPLVRAGIIKPEDKLHCFSLTGYSGGGKKMIAEYESKTRDPLLCAPRQYALTQSHKHLKEMVAVTGIDSAPIFCPIVADFYSGMEVTVPLFADGFTADDIKKVYKNTYRGPIVSYCESADRDGFMSALSQSGKDSMKITVTGNEERILLCAVYDNLGKGASGAAVECLNIVTGKEKTYGLEI